MRFKFAVLHLFFIQALFSCNSQKAPAPGEVTFTEHIAPIVFKNCSPCHRAEQAGPFPLLTYEDISKRAQMIKFVTGIRFMPPWPADPACARSQ